MRLLLGIITISALVAATGQAGAQETTDFKEQFKLIKGVNAIASVGADLFGDRVNLYTGGLEFVQTDVSLPGNNDLPVTLGRRLTAGQYTYDDQPFGKWSLDIPHLHGIFARGSISSLPGWVGADGTNARCTAFGAPADASGLQGSSTWAAGEFWRGNFMYIPGHGDQEMLGRAPDYTRAPDPITIDGITVAAFPVVTSGRWSIGCLPAIKNGATLGQGFLAVSPDGTAYKFDWLVSYSAATITKLSPAPAPSASLASDPEAGDGTHFTQTGVRSAVIQPTLPRTEVWILPSKIVDRFGNWVAYTYDPVRPRNLTRIESSDGRAIDLTYVPDEAGAPTALVETVFDGSRRWTYAYDVAVGNKRLQAVTLPDGSSWQLGQAQNLLHDPQYPREPRYCSEKIAVFPTVLQATFAHPSGASGTFTLEPVEHGRSNVVYSCVDRIITTPIFYTTNSLTSKSITGPGLGTLAWSYQYDPANGSFTSCDGCPGTASVNVTDPEGIVTRHVFGNRYFIDEGRLLQTFVGWNGSGADRIITYAYQPSSSANPYPPQFGHSDALLGDSGSDLRLMPLLSRTITQQGVDFVWRADTFDSFGRPVQVTKHSSLGISRTETTTYADHDSRWVIGQVGQVDSAGKTIVKYDYDPATLQPVLVTRFGVADSAMTYHADGTLASHTKGKQTRQFVNYKRGIAQHIAYAGTTITASSQIDNLGNPEWTRDAAQNTTSYGYDAMGRLALVRYPAADTTAWADTSISFAKSAVSSYDLPAGHWVREIRTGSGVTAQYFDALLRPVYFQQWDAANPAATLRMSRAGFNSRGQQIYQSYPKRTYGELGDGIHSGFDAIGRPTVTGTISELGTLYSGFNYSLGGFERHYSNNRQNASLIRYQAFDDPADATVIGIIEPQGVTTVIVRDNFGKALSVTRSGGGKTATRHYVYDANERLCKTIEPESGGTVEEYDAYDNLAWRAAGLALTSTTACDRASVLASTKTRFTYDALNRLTSTAYGDASPSIARTYTYDSLPETTTSNGSVWTNTYNKRRLLTRESLAYGGATYNIDHGYDANASRNTLTYPDGAVIAYAPNAFGEATQVGSYASAITYHPNGAVASFLYGNGIAHTMTQNVRGLPEWSTDAGVLRDNYFYDQNSNVAFIWDYHEGISNRGMTYDNLDRLTQVDSATQWGGTSYTYDALDNLTSTYLVSGANSRATTHTYSTVTNLLTNIASSNAAYNMAIAYDTRGNVTQRGTQGFVFDRGNRMSSATGKGTYVYDGAGRRVSTVGTDGVNRITVYSQEGKLLFFRSTSTPIAAGVKYIHLRNHIIAESSPSGTVYDHTDGLGSPVAITDGNRALVSRTRYEPYGLTFAGASPTIGFTGHLNAADIGLVYMQQRYYDPVAGRFLSMDPVTTDANTGGSFNRYAYVNNSPYKYIDPDGRAAETVFDAASLALSIAIYKSDPSLPNGLGVAIDGLAMAVPFVPGGVGVIRSVGRGAAASKAAMEAGEAGAKGAKSRNKAPEALKEAEGRPHSIVEQSGPEGQYTTHNGDGTSKQYRGSGKDHGGIPRPNVKETGKNVTPDGKEFTDKGRVRPARPDEIPKG